MFKKELFKISHLLYDNKFLSFYNEYSANQWKPVEELIFEQERRLRIILEFAYESVPYYTKLFDKIGIQPREINKIEHLKYLPILTKEIIKNNWEDFIPKNIKLLKHYKSSTGGTTGTPFNYRVSKEQRTRILVSLYRGWGYAGYKLGDKVLFFGGTSIGVGREFNIFKNLQNYSRNIMGLSSYDLDDDILFSYIKKINHVKPKFIRSYPAAIYFLSKWIKLKKLLLHKPNAIFSTGEILFPEMRQTIENVFNTKIFDGYGLADGGVTAFECSAHNGMHLDYENAVFEVIDTDNKNIEDGIGKVLLSSLYNFSMPFIRYETGDNVRISNHICDCGKHTKMIDEVISRSVDFFITPSKKYILGWFFHIIFERYAIGIDKYQVIQKDYDLIEIKLVINSEYSDAIGNNIISLIKEKSSEWNVVIKIVDNIKLTNAGKYKFIINEILFD